MTFILLHRKFFSFLTLFLYYFLSCFSPLMSLKRWKYICFWKMRFSWPLLQRLFLFFFLLLLQTLHVYKFFIFSFLFFLTCVLYLFFCYKKFIRNENGFEFYEMFLLFFSYKSCKFHHLRLHFQSAKILNVIVAWRYDSSKV